MAIANTKVFPKSLDRTINQLFFDGYAAEPSLYDKIATGSGPNGSRMMTVGAGSGGYWREAELSGLGELREVKEGNPIQFLLPTEGNQKDLKPTKYGAGFQITEEMVKDEVHRNFLQMPSKLAKAANYKKETVFWDLFNSGFTTHLAWDGNEIFEPTARTTLQSLDAQNNRPSTDVALGETGLQAAFQYFDGLKDSNGFPIGGGTKFVLLVPTASRWKAMSIWKSEGPDLSADRNINTLDPENMEESWRPLVVRHLTSSTAWYLLSIDLHDFRFMWWDDVKMESADDFHTGNALWKTTMRFGVACFNPTGAYGTTGA